MTTYNSPFGGNVIQPTDVSYRKFTIAANTTLSWPLNGNTSGDYAARIMEVTASTSGLNLIMPPSNQASVGQDALIRNLGSNSFTVTDYNSGTIITILAGQAEYIYITDNSTVAGLWGIINFGAGTSSADSATLAGYGLSASSLTLNQSHPVSGLIDAATLQASDLAQTKVWSSGSGSVTLPAATTLGNNWFFLIKNNGTGSLTVNTTGADLIDGTVSKVYNPSESSFIVCTGAGYVSIGYGVSSDFAFTALVKPVTGGAYTLSSSDAKNTIQEYVGSLTSDVVVTYPPVVNLYVVSNQVTANGYTLTIKTNSIGASTVVVPAGQQATLVCDGVNFFNANSVQIGIVSFSVSDGTAGTPAISFASETNTGIFRPGTGEFGITVLGSLVADVTASGLAVTGSGTFSSGISGGGF